MIKNAPKRIYLQVGEDISKDEDVNFKDLEEVTWCEDKINDSDICYIREGKCYTPDVSNSDCVLFGKCGFAISNYPECWKECKHFELKQSDH